MCVNKITEKKKQQNKNPRQRRIVIVASPSLVVHPKSWNLRAVRLTHYKLTSQCGLAASPFLVRWNLRWCYCWTRVKHNYLLACLFLVLI